MFKLVTICTIALLLTFSQTHSFGASITDDPNYNFEVLFTNPECDLYKYTKEVLSNDGTLLKNKPQNAYCSKRDAMDSGTRNNSPQQRLIDWIQTPDVKSIDLAYFSFSDSRALGELCKAIQKGIHVRMIIDSESDMGNAEKLMACGAQIFSRGHKSGIELAHIKLVVFKHKNKDLTKIVFSSGNLTSGTVLHHENWNFIQVSTNSYFAQEHFCVYENMVTSETGAEFRTGLAECRHEIKAEKENDITSFFIPADGKQAQKLFFDQIKKSDVLKIAAHRFSNKKMLELISEKLNSSGVVQIIVDDDIYWAQKNLVVGANTRDEAKHIQNLIDIGATVQYIETNHYEKLLHHNKFIVFDTDAVWTGAGNLTGAAFSGNYENFYLITIPEVVESYNRQYGYMWKKLSTSWEKMPQTLSKPEANKN